MSTPKRSPIERASIKAGGGDLRRRSNIDRPAQKRLSNKTNKKLRG
jgi:hypothetical protein